MLKVILSSNLKELTYLTSIEKESRASNQLFFFLKKKKRVL